MGKSFLAWTIASLALIGLFFVFQEKTADNLCANSISCIRNLTGDYEDNAKTAQFQGKSLHVPWKEIAQAPIVPRVLGNTNLEKRIEVDLSKQHLYAFEGDKLVYDFPISSGKWAPTPTGTFKIWVKLRYTRMTGGDTAAGTFYDLPNVPYVMFYYNDEVAQARGFSLHGAYWHNNFGHPMSHGCVNIKPMDAEKLYFWADPPTNGNLTYSDKDNPGTKVIVYGVAPEE